MQRNYAKADRAVYLRISAPLHHIAEHLCKLRFTCAEAFELSYQNNLTTGKASAIRAAPTSQTFFSFQLGTPGIAAIILPSCLQR